MYRFFYFNNIIPAQDCEAFIRQYETKTFTKGEIKKEGITVEDPGRDSDIYWIDPKSPMCRAMWSYMLEANQHLNIDLNQSHELAQLARYTTSQHYTWHVDTFYKKGLPVRNLSGVLQLSNSNNYEGGELQLYNGDNDPEVPPAQSQGSLVFFRSNEWHRVTPLITGTRYSLVFWA